MIFATVYSHTNIAALMNQLIDVSLKFLQNYKWLFPLSNTELTFSFFLFPISNRINYVFTFQVKLSLREFINKECRRSRNNRIDDWFYFVILCFVCSSNQVIYRRSFQFDDMLNIEMESQKINKLNDRSKTYNFNLDVLYGWMDRILINAIISHYWQLPLKPRHMFVYNILTTCHRSTG